MSIAILGLHAPAAPPARAQSAAMASCEQSYADWSRLRDSRLRRLDQSAASWCAPGQADVAELKTRLFALDQNCAGVAPDEKGRVVALMTQNLKLLKGMTVCPAPAQVTASQPSPPGSWQTGVSPAPAPAPTAQAATAATSPPAPSSTPAVGPQANVARVVPRSDPPTGPVKPAEKPAPQAGPKEPPREIAKPSAPPRAVAPKTTASTDAPAVPANTSQPVRVAGAEPPRSAIAIDQEEECLAIRRTSPETFMIDNSRCQQQRVLAAIELRLPGAPVRCFTKSITDQLAITGGTEPQIYFQCISGTAGCTVESMRSMFPECAGD